MAGVTLNATINNPVNANIGAATGTGTFTDEPGPGVFLSRTFLPVDEGTTTYTVVLDTQPTTSATMTPSETLDAVGISPPAGPPPPRSRCRRRPSRLPAGRVPTWSTRT